MPLTHTHTKKQASNAVKKCHSSWWCRLENWYIIMRSVAQSALKKVTRHTTTVKRGYPWQLVSEVDATAAHSNRSKCLPIFEECRRENVETSKHGRIRN